MWFFKKKQSHYQDLVNKWSERHRKIQENFWYKHGGKLTELLHDTRSFTIGSLAGLILLLSPAASSPLAQGNSTAHADQKPFDDLAGPSGLILDLLQYIPNIVRPLSPYEEQRITQLLTQKLGFSVTAELDGIRLERNYGYIGQEQHLARFPGDNMSIHLADQAATDLFYSYGMAPGLGAYGYFAPSQSQMTPEEDALEKWYIAVQTFLAPGYNDNVKKYNDFFRYHKMLVMNPANGKAVVADIGDAGPSPWTGKSLGGSPEVMHYLERVDGAQRGTVLYFFIDDPNDTVPLGPITYN